MNNRPSILEEVLSSQDEQLLQNFDPTASVQNLLKSIDSRGADIIRQRYSLDGQPIRTLEQIGNNYGVTRERVRQIESAAVKELRAKQKALLDVANVIESILKAYGKVMQEDHLVETLLERREKSLADRAAILFVLELHENFDLHDETEEMHKAWGTRGSDLRLASDLVDAFADILESKKETISQDEVVSYLSEHPRVQNFQGELPESTLLSHLLLSKKIKKNPFGEWGISDWSQVSPRGVKDKAFVVLDKANEPMHFVEIAEKINASGFDHKKAHPQTVHNELIKDERFVLVGRGIYALKSWGYEPGTVADVLEHILKKNGGTMEKDALIEEVLKQRMVKKNTVALGLQNKDRFQRLPDGRYTLLKK